MRISKSIFDSNAEREAFLALESRWSPKVRPYPQLPLAKLIKLDKDDQLTPGQRQYFFATNVDYTFCVDGGQPLFSVEFDGIGGGYSSNGKYHQARSTVDPYRRLKMDFKLRVSREVGYPLVVVSFDQLHSARRGVANDPRWHCGPIRQAPRGKPSLRGDGRGSEAND